MIRLIAFAPLLLLVGCATLSEDECKGGDWYEIGRSDGADGRKFDFILQHAKACNKFDIKPIASEWRRGRDAGLPLYCTPVRAHAEGKRGKHLSPVCPVSQQARLERANERGLTYHRIRQHINETQRRISHLNTEIASLAPDDPSRSALISERSFLRLDLLSLRTDLARYRDL